MIGQLCTYPVEAGAENTDEPEDPVLEPYARLEIPGTLYISSLALFEGFRGMGLGTEMISLARDQARERGFWMALSLLVFEQNKGAVKLYEREGFREVDRAHGRAAPPHQPHRRRNPDDRAGITQKRAENPTTCRGASRSALHFVRLSSAYMA